MSVILDMEFHLGEHWNISYEVNDGSNDDIDISGATLEWKLSTLAGVAVLTAGVGTGITIVDGATGSCLVSITPTAQTNASVAAGRYKYQFKVTTGGGTVTIQARGHLNVVPSL